MTFNEGSHYDITAPLDTKVGLETQRNSPKNNELETILGKIFH